MRTMRRCTWPVAVVLALAVALAAAVLARPGSAQAISAGCQALNDPSLDRSAAPGTGSGGIGPHAFAAGDTVTITAGPPVIGDPPLRTSIFLVADSDVVLGVTGFPGTITYTFPADVTTGLGWDSNAASVFYTWTVGCTPAPQQPTSVAQCKNGGWMNLVDNKGKPFKSQNACTNFVENNNNQGNDNSH